MNNPKTSSGKACKICLKKGSPYHIHSPSKTPSSKRSAKKSPTNLLDIPPNTFSQLPCDVLLKIARELPASDYGRLSLVSVHLQSCLKTGRYNPKDENKLVDFLKKYRDEEIENLAAVTRDWSSIQHIKDPSEKVQFVAVNKHGGSIQYIKDPSEKVQLASVKQHGFSIQFIKNPSEKLQLAAVEQNAYSIRYIKDPSEKVKLVAKKR